MHYILHVQVPGFYVRALEQADPSLRTAALVVHRENAVLDVNVRAAYARVAPGMSLAEAKLLVRDGVFRAWGEEDYRPAQAEWLDVCAEHSSVVEPGEQDEAYLDLSAHPEPLDVAICLARDLRERQGIHARLGMARVKWLAKLACSECGRVDPSVAWELSMRDALEHPEAFLCPLPVRALLPVAPEDRKRLDFLGYKTAGEVAALPLELLKSQFGARAMGIFQASRGQGAESVRALWPKDAVRAGARFPGGARTADQLDAGLRSLAKRLAGSLQAKESQASLVEFEIELDSGRIEKRKRRFRRPLTGERSALSALGLLLEEALRGTVSELSDSEASFERQNGFESIVAIRVSLPDLEKASRAQNDLSGFYSRSARSQTAESALRSVRAAYGDESVRIAGELPQPRRMRVLRVWRDATGWR